MFNPNANVSRRNLLGVLGLGTAALTLEACSDSSKKNTGASASGPQAADPSLDPSQQVLKDAKNLEPQKYVRTFTVDASGKNGQYRTIKDAFAAVSADKARILGLSQFVASQSVPWAWHKVEIQPGEYHEFLTVPPHTALVGMGSAPTDVRIHWDGSDNVIETTGRSLYARNVLFEHTSNDPMSHPMRESGPSGDVGMQRKQRRTAVFENVHFKTPHTAPVTKCTNDMVPFGMALVFHECVFNGPGQPQAVNLVTDATNEPGGVIQASFVGCQVIANHEQHPDTSIGAEPAPAAPFGGPDTGQGRPDEVLWMNGSWDVGRVYGVQGLIVTPLVGLNGKTQGTKAGTSYYLVNPGEVQGITTVKADPGVKIEHEIRKGFRLPVGCFGSAEQQFFGRKPGGKPIDIGDSMGASGTTDTVSVKAGDVYWVRYTLTESVRVSGMSVDSYTTGAIAGCVALETSNAPIADGNGYATGSAGKVGSGTTDLQPRWFFPGQGALWVGVAFTADGEVGCTTATAGMARKGSGFSSGQLAPTQSSVVAAGTKIPALHLVTTLPSGFGQ